MSARGYPKRSARAAGINTYSTSRRPRRSAGTSSGGGGDRLVVSTENLGVPAVPWTKVLRYPSAPLDEPYFGRSPKASFQIPMWVRVDELTEEEKAKYDEEKKKKEEQRALWKKQMEKSKDEPSQEVVEGQSKDDDVQKSSNIEEGGDKSQPSTTVAEGKTDTSSMQVDPSSDPQTVKESQEQQDQIIMNEDTQQAIADGPNLEEEKAQSLAESAATSSATANNGQQSSTEEGQQGEGSGQSQQ